MEKIQEQISQFIDKLDEVQIDLSNFKAKLGENTRDNREDIESVLNRLQSVEIISSRNNTDIINNFINLQSKIQRWEHLFFNLETKVLHLENSIKFLESKIDNTSQESKTFTTL